MVMQDGRMGLRQSRRDNGRLQKQYILFSTSSVHRKGDTVEGIPGGNVER